MTDDCTYDESSQPCVSYIYRLGHGAELSKKKKELETTTLYYTRRPTRN